MERWDPGQVGVADEQDGFVRRQGPSCIFPCMCGCVHGGYCGEEGDIVKLPAFAVFAGGCAPRWGLRRQMMGGQTLIGGERSGDGEFLVPDSNVEVVTPISIASVGTEEHGKVKVRQGATDVSGTDFEGGGGGAKVKRGRRVRVSRAGGLRLVLGGEAGRGGVFDWGRG